MAKKDKDNNPEPDPDDPLGHLSEEERKILDEVIGDFPEDIQEKIRSGEGKIIMRKMDGKGGPFQMGLGMMVGTIGEVMQNALMSGKDPLHTATSEAAVDISLAFFEALQSFPQQGDILFKAMVYGYSAHVGISPKELLENMAEHAPETMPILPTLYNPNKSKDNDDDNETADPEEVRRLNELFNLESAPEPTIPNDDNKEEK